MKKMKKIIILLIMIVVASIAMGVVTGCNSVGGESTHEHKYADAYTCHDRTCTGEGCGQVEKATTAHKFADEFTCHDRTCTDCGSVEKATMEHKFADAFTCHDRTCMNCGSVEKATTEHSWGEWVTVREPSCTEKACRRANVTIAEIRKPQIFRLRDTLTPTNLPVTTEFVPLKIADI